MVGAGAVADEADRVGVDVERPRLAGHALLGGGENLVAAAAGHEFSGQQILPAVALDQRLFSILPALRTRRA